MVTLKQLTHFLAVAELGQVSRAADHCHVTQPALTTSLKNLESEVGAELFVRHSGGLRITPRGENFLQHVQHVFSTLESAIGEARSETNSAEGMVSLAITDTVSGYLLPWLLPVIRQQLPQVEVKLQERNRDEIEKGLRSGRHDLAIVLVSNLSDSKDIARETLLRSPRRLWTSWDHPLARRSDVSLKEVAAMDYILLDMDEHVDTVKRYWARFGLEPKIVFRSKSIEAVRSLVAKNEGVTILSDLVYRQWSHDGGRIRRWPLTDSIPSMDLGLAQVRGLKLTPAAAAMARVLRISTRALRGDMAPVAVV
ncbi:LysR family transcriptional regulator [Caenimonas soli]|uniref:LysR family transcriptional regulator n=1 Tax=Caenimonas soli TaxID=2735555 RepID=UPI0015526EE6|nr:LysR family transcriptional regulator [Caenimonas soli]NPC56912.1 LysR family transcriptional regulator [Caenimonas soli]